MCTKRGVYFRAGDCYKKHVLRHPVFVRFLMAVFLEPASSSASSRGGEEAPRRDAAALSSGVSIRRRNGGGRMKRNGGKDELCCVPGLVKSPTGPTCPGLWAPGAMSMRIGAGWARTRDTYTGQAEYTCSALRSWEGG